MTEPHVIIHGPAPPAVRTSLNTLIARTQTQIDEIRGFDGPLIDPNVEEPIHGSLYTTFLE
jgi:hypothetical protein